MSLPWTVAIIATVLGALFPYLSSTRKLSGRVATTEALTLWSESTKMREEYRARISELNDVLKRCEKRIEELERRNDLLDKENSNLQNVIAKLGKELRSHLPPDSPS